MLRWERLVGRLAAAAAQRKALLLLQWLHLHLAFTEGCSSRGTWLSPKVGAGGWEVPLDVRGACALSEPLPVWATTCDVSCSCLRGAWEGRQHRGGMRKHVICGCINEP